MNKFEDLLGKTILRIDGAVGDEEMRFILSDGDFILYHSQDCCESVQVEEIIGDVSDIVGSPVLLAEEVEGEQDQPLEDGPKECQGESYTWTFYKLRTLNGDVTIRWLGQSNGYYSESVCCRWEPSK